MAKRQALAALVAALLAGLATAQPGNFTCPDPVVRFLRAGGRRRLRRRRRCRRRSRAAAAAAASWLIASAMHVQSPAGTCPPLRPSAAIAAPPRKPRTPSRPLRQVNVTAGTTLSNTFLVAGSTYRLPAGNYTLTDTVTPNGPLCIQGAGSDAATGTVIQKRTSIANEWSLDISGRVVGLFDLSITQHPSSPATDTGSVNARNGGTLRADRIAFRGMGGASGGAVRADGGSTVNLTDARFEDCFATGTVAPGVGGAMRIAGGSSVNLYGATTIARTRALRGGAFWVDSSNVRFHGPVTITNATVAATSNRWAGHRRGVRAA
jgi:hypothetical protein